MAYIFPGMCSGWERGNKGENRGRQNGSQRGERSCLERHGLSIREHLGSTHRPSRRIFAGSACYLAAGSISFPVTTAGNFNAMTYPSILQVTGITAQKTAWPLILPANRAITPLPDQGTELIGLDCGYRSEKVRVAIGIGEKHGSPGR